MEVLVYRCRVPVGYQRRLDLVDIQRRRRELQRPDYVERRRAGRLAVCWRVALQRFERQKVSARRQRRRLNRVAFRRLPLLRLAVDLWTRRDSGSQAQTILRPGLFRKTTADSEARGDSGFRADDWAGLCDYVTPETQLGNRQASDSSLNISILARSWRD